jgi:hypothetical protein
MLSFLGSCEKEVAQTETNQQFYSDLTNRTVSINEDIVTNSELLLPGRDYSISTFYSVLRNHWDKFITENTIEVVCSPDCDDINSRVTYLYSNYSGLSEISTTDNYMVQYSGCDNYLESYGAIYESIDRVMEVANENLSYLKLRGYISESEYEFNIRFFSAIRESQNIEVDFGLFIEEFTNLSDYGTFNGDFTAYSIATASFYVEYFSNNPFGAAFDDDDDVQAFHHLTGLLGGYIGAVDWAIRGELYDQAGQDCMISGFMGGATLGGII